MLFDKKELNQSTHCSLKINWMQSVLGVNIPLENSLNALDKRPGFKVVDFKFHICSVFKKELNLVNMTFFRDAEHECVMTGTVSSICCDLDGLCDILAHEHIVARMWRLYKMGIGLTTGFIGSHTVTHNYSVYPSQLTIAAATLL
jgi:hypothetical protein